MENFLKEYLLEEVMAYLQLNEITEPLKNYITFDYKTDVELYWLVIIALNLAQDDLKETQTETSFDKNIFDFLLSNVNGEEEK